MLTTKTIGLSYIAARGLATTAAAAAASKAPRLKTFKIYRWNPDKPTENPT